MALLSTQTLELRAHHLLCILGFRGLGYSQAFAEYMARVIRDIRSGLYYHIRVTDRCDAICSACPHIKNNQCLKEENAEAKAKQRDSEVMKRLGVKLEDSFHPDDLQALIAEKIAPSDTTQICQGCQWLDLGYCISGVAALLAEH